MNGIQKKMNVQFSKNPRAIIEAAEANDEPVFVLRAKDKLSIEALTAYIKFAKMDEVEEDFLQELCAIKLHFHAWQKQNPHRIKYPD